MTSGVLLIILGLSIERTLSGSAPFIALGIFLIIQMPLKAWAEVYRNRKILFEEVEITLTSEGIQWRTATTRFDVSWDMIKRVYELKDLWIFVVNRLTRISLYKHALSQEQQAELAAFIAARSK